MATHTVEVRAEMLARGDMILIPPGTVAYVDGLGLVGDVATIYLRGGKAHRVSMGELVDVIASAETAEQGAAARS
jgi:hypothetical protein